MMRYRDRVGDVWETMHDGRLRLVESKKSPHSVGATSSERLARETYGPLVEIPNRREELAQLLGMTDAASWDDLFNVIKIRQATLAQRKEEIAAALGKRSVTTWEELIDTADLLLAESLNRKRSTAAVRVEALRAATTLAAAWDPQGAHRDLTKQWTKTFENYLTTGEMPS